MECFCPAQLRICDVTQLSERFQGAGSDYVVDMVMNHEEDGTSLPFLALVYVVLFLRSTSTEGENLANSVDVIATVMMLVLDPGLIYAHSSSKNINAVQRDLVVLVNQIVIYSSPDAVKALVREIISVIILAVIDDGMFNQLF